MLRFALILVLQAMITNGFAAPDSESPPASGPQKPVTYEDFGAKGDGVTDDLPAIVAAHEHANKLYLPVRARDDATYHLGTRALTVNIETNTDWGRAQFVIDDSKGVENHKLPLFHVRSRLAPVPLEIEHLSRGQERLERGPEAGEHDLLVLVENKERNIFIRGGLNANRGFPQREVFILKKDGTIEGAIEWDYDVVTRVEARPIDPDTLTVRGGVFTQIANQMHQEVGYNYWFRNIQITRANAVIEGLTLSLKGEGELGCPYSGFLRAEQTARITFRDCRIPGRKIYWTIGSVGKPVRMGTYGYVASRVVDFRMLGCRMENINDTSRWGVATTNFMKNILVEDCVLSRMDVHEGVSGHYIIRRSELGHHGIKAVGKGLLMIEDTTVHSHFFVEFRADYGSTWDGEVIVRNCRWLSRKPLQTRFIFAAENDGTHDFGYPCSMPRIIRIDGLFIGGAKGPESKMPDIYFFDKLPGAVRPDAPFPYRPTERIEARSLKTESGKFPETSPDPELNRLINVRHLD